MKRKQHSKEFKAKVALEALKGQKTVNEIAADADFMKWMRSSCVCFRSCATKCRDRSG
jgi:transposase-like protein